MNEKQIALARHALGLSERRNVSYRNHFVTGLGSADYDEWEAMVKAGDANWRAGTPLSGGDPVFFLTRAGAEKALRPGDTLDPADWPPR